MLLAAGGILIGCGGGGDGPRHQVIDEGAATYRGVGIGDSRGRVLATFGRTRANPREPVAPRGRDAAKVHQAPAWDCRTGKRRGPRAGETRRYDDVAFALDGGRVCGFIVIEDGAATRRGVGIGDPLELAEREYPELECQTIEYGDHPVSLLRDRVSVCAGKLGPLKGPDAPAERREPGRWIWFAGDPIDTIQVNNERLGVGLPFEVIPVDE